MINRITKYEKNKILASLDKDDGIGCVYTIIAGQSSLTESQAKLITGDCDEHEECNYHHRDIYDKFKRYNPNSTEQKYNL